MSIVHRSKRMSLILSISAMTLGFASLHAQDVPVRRPVTEPAPSSAPSISLPAPASSNTYSILAGFNVYAKAGLNTTPAKGRKTEVSMMSTPDLNGSIMIPFHNAGKVGFGLDFGYSYVGYLGKPAYKNETDILNETIYEQYKYFQFFPHINAFGFLAGVSFGSIQTMDAYKVNLGDQPTSVIRNNDMGYIQSSMELRIGGAIPVFDDKMSRLCINIMAGYALNGLVSDDNTDKYFYTIDRDENGNKMGEELVKNIPRPVTLAIGFSLYHKIPVPF